VKRAGAPRALVAALLPACVTPACSALVPTAPAAPLAELASESPAPPPTSSPTSAPTSVLEAPLPAASASEACTADEGCGFAPAIGRCVADPRANQQPAVVDQGIVCYCDAGRCATLRVLPVACESDASCAIATDPRPHPIAADAAHPHHAGRPCRGATGPFALSAACELTNLCTLRRHACARPR
jgi:hypothetical protein